MVNQYTKFEVSRFTRYEAAMAVQNAEKWGGLGRLGLRSSAMSPFDREHTTFYSTLIETMRLSCTVFTARSYASAVLAMGLCPCQSVTSRSSTKTANTGSHKQHHTIAQGL